MKISPAFMIQMSHSESRELQNRLYVLIEHMLKLAFIKGQAETHNRRGWTVTVHNQRRALLSFFADHPGMKPKLTDKLVDKTYDAVVADLQGEYPSITFPYSRRLTVQDILGGSLS